MSGNTVHTLEIAFPAPLQLEVILTPEGGLVSLGHRYYAEPPEAIQIEVFRAVAFVTQIVFQADTSGHSLDRTMGAIKADGRYRFEHAILTAVERLQAHVVLDGTYALLGRKNGRAA